MSSPSSPQAVIKPVELSRHWNCSRAYVAKLEKRGMPAFESLSAADQWRAQNAPPKRRKARRVAVTEGTYSGEAIDVSLFLAPAGADFDAMMIGHAEEVAQIAFGLYKRACESGDPTAVALELRNWSDAVGRARDVREKMMDLQERAKTLIHVDKAKDIAGRQLQALRQELLRVDAKIAQDCNPQDPALATRVIRAWVDAMLARLHSSEQVLEGIGVA